MFRFPNTDPHPRTKKIKIKSTTIAPERKMKSFKFYFFAICNLISFFIIPLSAAEKVSKKYTELKNLYDFHCINPTDINEHLPVLRELTLECQSVVEIGVRNMVSTWAILQGLSENHPSPPFYLGIDLSYPPLESLTKATSLAKSNGIYFKFWQVNDMTIEMIQTDLLFIDSLHTYCHLTYELEKFSSQVAKYIVLHDTSEPWGELDDTDYYGDYSEYPSHIDRTKRGLWPAVVDFLDTHPEWSLHQRYFNLHGFTILKRN